MSTVIVIGAQWGDEGKGKIVDLLTHQADYVVRFQGGANAGHTLVIDGVTSVLHLLPSGVYHQDVHCVIGNGVVIDPVICCREIDGLIEAGIPVDGRLHISEQAHVVLPQHQQIDGLREDQRGDDKIGTTKRGIGPAYEAKVARRGLRCGDLVNADRLRRRLEAIVPETNRYIELMLRGTPLSFEETFAQLHALGERLRPYVCDTASMIAEAIDAGKQVLFEGAQGSALDVDHGTYPYVTSSTTVSSGACSGSGVGPTVIDQVLGVTKAYCTRVGEGPFPTEFNDADAEAMRERGGEFGATTGRPRRCGWIDAVALRHAVRVNGVTGLVVSKVDVLAGVEHIQIGVGYQLDGQELSNVPSNIDDLARVRVQYETLPGWDDSCTTASTGDELPDNLRRYLARLEELVGVPVAMVSYGPGRDECLQLQPLFCDKGSS